MCYTSAHLQVCNSTQSSALKATKCTKQAKRQSAADPSVYVSSRLCRSQATHQRLLFPLTYKLDLDENRPGLWLALAACCVARHSFSKQWGADVWGSQLRQWLQAATVVTAKEPIEGHIACLQGCCCCCCCCWHICGHLQVLQLWGVAVASLAQLGLLRLLSPWGRQATHPLPALPSEAQCLAGGTALDRLHAPGRGRQGRIIHPGCCYDLG